MLDDLTHGKSKTDILSMIGDEASPGSKKNEHLMAAITVRCTEDLERALKSLEESQRQSTTVSDKLAGRVYWLNLVLTAATVIGTIIALLTFLRSP